MSTFPGPPIKPAETKRKRFTIVRTGQCKNCQNLPQASVKKYKVGTVIRCDDCLENYVLRIYRNDATWMKV